MVADPTGSSFSFRPSLFRQEAAEPSSKPDDILESTVDAAEWRLEVERVLPQLKVTIRTDNKVGGNRPELDRIGSGADVCPDCSPGLEEPSGPDASTQRRDQVVAQRHQGGLSSLFGHRRTLS